MNNVKFPIIAGAEEKEAVKGLTHLVAASFKETAADANLRLPPPQTIRAGLAGGLPFDGLTTDLFLGCLPASQICYGSCFAAKEAFAAGYDFTRRVPNILNEDVLRGDLRTISSKQGFLRNGWNSDPSWDWERAARLSELVAEAGKHPVFLTKAFLAPGGNQYGRMATVGAEFRVCISAFDTDAQLKHRFQIMHDYRQQGGLSVPVVMTAAFKDEALNNRQAKIVDQVLDLNLPGAENSIRFNPRSHVMNAINPNVCGPVANTGDLWAGRIFPDKLTAPTLSSVPAAYRGVQPYRSQNSVSSLEALFADPVPTHAEILGGAVRGKPICAGVPMAWQKASTDITPK